MTSPSPPSLAEIVDAAAALGDEVARTPVYRVSDPRVERALGGGALWLKLELLQRTGSFKLRGALTVMTALPPAARARGVVALSAGNHAIAVAYAAGRLGCPATVVMPASASPARVATCRSLGATVELVPDIHAALARVEQLAADTGASFVHPFEGPRTALGTATLGLELSEQLGPLDAVIVPIGGGGLAAGVACALKALRPSCRIYGVEPSGAATMHRSLQAGRPVAIDRIATIADSLGAPRAEPYSFELCRTHLDELVLVDDAQIRGGMRFLAEFARLAAEPAAAAATAAALGPLRDRLAGAQVCALVCGSNLDGATFARLLVDAPDLLAAPPR